MRIHWAWVPAAILAVAASAVRLGWIVTGLAILAGLCLAAYAEWRARRRAARNG
jgi:hypothetical protein